MLVEEGYKEQIDSYTQNEVLWMLSNFCALQQDVVDKIFIEGNNLQKRITCIMSLLE